MKANSVGRQQSRSCHPQPSAHRPKSQEIIRPPLVESFSIIDDAQNIFALEGLLADLDRTMVWLRSIMPPTGDGADLLSVASELSLLSDEDIVRQHRELVAHQAAGMDRCGVMLADCESMRRILVGALEVRDSPALFRSKMLPIIREVRRRKAKGAGGVVSRQSSGREAGGVVSRQSSGAVVPARRGQVAAQESFSLFSQVLRPPRNSR